MGKRNASIRTEEDCIILSLNNDTYRNLLSDDSKRLRALDIAFICNNFFFVNISPILFDKYYFAFFKASFRKKDDILYQQGIEMDTVFLLKEGVIKLEIYCSVLDLYNIIKNNILTIEKNNQSFKLSEKTIKNLKDTYINDSFYYNLRNKNNAFAEQLNLKKKMLVFICNTYECFGLIEYFLNSEYKMSCYVNSQEAKLFEISKYNLEKIIIGEKQILSNYHQSVCNKLLSQIKRLNKIKEDYIKQIEYKIKEKFYDETKTMKYFIRGQVGITRPYTKEKIKMKNILFDDYLSENKTNKEMPYTKTEENIMPVINNKRNNTYKNHYNLIRNANEIFNNKENNKQVNNNIQIFKDKEEKEIPISLINKYNNKPNLNSIMNSIKNNTFSKTIVNCGRTFLSLRQIKNKLRNIEHEYDYEHLNTEINNSKNITNTNLNTRENYKDFLYKNEFDVNTSSNLRYSLLDTGNILKKTKRYINPRISFNITKKYKTKSTMQTTRTSSIRNNFWKIKQINNFDEIKNFNPNKRLVNTILIKSIDTEPKEKSNPIKKNINRNEKSILLSQTRNFQDY